MIKMDKKSFKKKHSLKEFELSYKEQFETLNERYTKIKDILKQVLKELKEEKEKRQLLFVECEKLASEVKEKDALLEHMRSVSEAVIDEYTALKVKCDLETEAANNASKRATKYFQENQILKISHGEVANDLEKDSNTPYPQEPYLEESVSELDVLNKLASELRSEVASLKLQLTKEIEKQSSLKEDFQIAKNLYEEEMKEHIAVKEKFQALQLKFDKVSLATDGFGEFAQAHLGILSDQDQGSSSEVYNSAVCDFCVISDSLKEKLEFSEQQISSYKQQNSNLLNQVKELEGQLRKLNAEVSASELLPIPPPPPPPPPSFNPIRSLITFIHAGKKSTKAVKKESLENPQQKALSELIDTIKKGNIQLKPTPKIVLNTNEKFTEAAALGEMKDILMTLKKKKSYEYEDKNSKNDARDFVKIEDICAARTSREVDLSLNIGADIDEELKVLLRKRSIKTITSIDDEYGDDCTSTSYAHAAPIPLCDFALKDEKEIVKDITTSYQIDIDDTLPCSYINEEKKAINDSNLIEQPELYDVLLQDSFGTVENPNIEECIFKDQTDDILIFNSSIIEEQISNSVPTLNQSECLAVPLHDVDENKIRSDSFFFNNSEVYTSMQNSGTVGEKNIVTDNTVVEIAVANADTQVESRCESYGSETVVQ